jgi:hypothetical protein
MIMKNEPVIVRAAITLAGAVVAVLVAFNVPITDQQQDAILGLVLAVAMVVLALWARSAVTPNSNVVEQKKGSDVIAGEGSELPTGQHIRKVGALDEIEGE